jgi:hypothetical protein
MERVSCEVPLRLPAVEATWQPSTQRAAIFIPFLCTLSQETASHMPSLLGTATLYISFPSYRERSTAFKINTRHNYITLQLTN